MAISRRYPPVDDFIALVASSRRSISQGAAKNSAQKNKNSAARGSFLSPPFFIFSRAVFYPAL